MKTAFLILASFSLVSSFIVSPSSRVNTYLRVNGDDETTKTKDDISKLEADFAKPAVDPNQVKNADGSFGTPDGGYSAALPFLPRPKNLDGTFPGDNGFDPLGLGGSDKSTLAFMREAEIKHSRLAMLACVGWPLAELLDKAIANTLGLPVMLTKSGASPSLLNGGLDKINPFYWAVALSIGALVEYDTSELKKEQGKNYMIGDVGYDVLKLMPDDSAGKFDRQTSEVKHGRIAMLAIVGYAAQEALYRIPVTQEFPFSLF